MPHFPRKHHVDPPPVNHPMSVLEIQAPPGLSCTGYQRYDELSRNLETKLDSW